MFPSRIPRKKWNAETRDVRVDDFVMFQTPVAVSGKWNVSQVVNVFLEHDGKVRSVKVKTRCEEYERFYPAEGYEEKLGVR